MTTPIVDFVKKYAEDDCLRLHMPGHKGVNLLGAERFDITEIDGADVLYSAKGIIRRSEENAATLFGTQRTVYSAEGSSLAIRGMVYLLKTHCKKIGKKAFVAAGRNAHKTFVTACALLGVEVDWLMPTENETMLSCKITAEYLEAYLSSAEEKPAAVYITSPDYLGNVADIAALSVVCKKHEILLLVDNAHGAYMNFLSPSRHPIALGADISCDSAHKTLPVLTGGAYIHISKAAPKHCVDSVDTALSLFASTSPSYLILQSLDMANKYLAEGYGERLENFLKKVTELKAELSKVGFCLVGDEPLKITVAPKGYGYTGTQLAELLQREKIVCEFSDPDFVVMMLTPEIGEQGLSKIKSALSLIGRRRPIRKAPPRPTAKEKRLSPSEAIFLPSKELCVRDCVGQILAKPSVMCPPAIPIVVCGEEIDENAVECFEYYGIKNCCVVEEGNI